MSGFLMAFHGVIHDPRSVLGASGGFNPLTNKFCSMLLHPLPGKRICLYIKVARCALNQEVLVFQIEFKHVQPAFLNVMLQAGVERC